MCAGTPVYCEQAVKLRRCGNEWPGQGGGCGECVRVYWYIGSLRAGSEVEAVKCLGSKP